MGAVKSIKADVIVVGAGIAGLALSVLVARSGGRVCLLDKGLPKSVRKEDLVIGATSQAWVSALARPSVRLLDEVGIWQWLLARNAAPFGRMQVMAERGKEFSFRGQDTGTKNLGYIVNNVLIRQSLWGCIEELGDGVSAIEDQPIHWDDVKGVLKTVGGVWVHAPVLVGADGAHSWVRQAADIALDVDQGVNDEAWIGMLSHQRLHEEVARQVFYHDGVVGILPSRDPGKSACVWSRSRRKGGAESSEMSKEDREQLRRRLAAFQKEGYVYSVEGEWQKRQIYSQRARSYYKGRAVLIGDAAGCVHPLAGQGLNIGLRQVTQLANWLEKANRVNESQDMGYYFQRYAHACEGFDALSQQVYRLCRQYMGRQGVERQLLGVGMRVLDYSSRLKQRLIEHALEGDMI